MRKSWIWIAVLGLSLCACGRKSADRPPPPPSKKTLQGSLYENLIAISAHKRAGVCEKTNLDLKKEMAKTLDEKKSEIAAHYETLLKKNAENVHIKDFGTIKITEPKKKESANDEWQTEDILWSDAADDFLEYKKSGKPLALLNANLKMRSLLSSDVYRVVRNYSYIYSRKGREVLENARTQTQKCLSEPACSTIEFSPEQLKFLNQDSYYREAIDQLKQEQGADARKTIETINGWLQEDLERKYLARKTIAVQKKSEGHFVVGLKGDALGTARSEVESIIKRYWNTEYGVIEISWTNSSLKDVYTILIDLILGERAYVRYSSASMHLPPITSATTVAHEFGHVIGLPDEYYEIWLPEKCGYRYEFNPGNLMSNSSTGRVLKEHFEELNRNY